MANSTLIIETTGSSGNTKLKDAWVYWREAGKKTKLLRAFGAGAACTNDLSGDPDATHWWEYNDPFITQTGVKADVYFSRGAKPLSDPQLDAVAGLFTSIVVPAAAPPPVPVTAGGANNSLRLPPNATIQIPDVVLTLTSPEELSLWPLLWAPPNPAYLTDGLDQGSAYWSSPKTDFSATAAAADSARTKERGVKLTGTIDAGATSATIQILNSKGTALSLKTSATATATTSVTAKVASGSFTCAFLFADPPTSFGLLQVVITATASRPLLEAFTLLLAGTQIALVDDHAAAANGQQAGPVMLETGKTAGNEVLVIDFDHGSPNDSVPGLSDTTVVRRMIVFDIVNESRPFPSKNPVPTGTTVANVKLPQMPMWMAELAFVGVTDEQFKELLLRRYMALSAGLADPFTPLTLRIELAWTLQLQWNGQDINSPKVTGSLTRPNQTYSDDQTFPASGTSAQVVVLHFEHHAALAGDDAKPITVAPGTAVPNALVPAPTVATFPIAKRRLPGVFMPGGPKRRWGRRADNANLDALIVEFQPSIALGNPAVEVMRGGDGTLRLTSLKLATGFEPKDPVATVVCPPGVIVDASGALVDPPSTAPPGTMPTFRVRGTNPTETEVGALIDAVVADKLNTPSPGKHVTFLTLTQWQETVKAILKKESRPAQSLPPFQQYETRPTGRFKWTSWRYGHPQRMPLFGAPHGYGCGQLDLLGAAPGHGATANDVWSILENVRSAVDLIIDDKARVALSFFTKGTGAAAFNKLSQRLQRAMLQRETVRRYNGAKEQEFDVENDQWVVKPSKGAKSNLQYCNEVLNTSLNYKNVAPLDSSDFGPGM